MNIYEKCPVLENDKFIIRLIEQSDAEDFYNNCGLLRLDLGSGCEKAELIYDVLSLIVEPFYDWFECSMIATKAPLYAVERIEALKKMGFTKSEEPLIGHQQNKPYFDYWIMYK